ncbi:Ankyrin repeat domain-containing protein, chloroplastic [Hondaea fermentalgiana]|uniref:Ankyrin repeat domain-containing protein, chloroplastic n=1 Tax=Hondaea fermentalgiana TaxID=2315210 RepID=A0A2R5G654_9STRA|nr:Ankyrin repeat domain-containing protein, chloroplastic [Hondaea fermentalgiana]|eukprot:GBG25258.1 Ankyrin repeat domain-containing protein, chloroplastic [Hondaea fermentalgiana]
MLSGASAYGSGHEDALLRHQSARCTLRLGEARIPEDPAVRESADVPGPGEYGVPAMRDERTAIVGPPDNTSSKAKIELACQREGARYRLRVPLSSYGYGHACRRKAHVHYGQCNDARCSKRGAWERRGDRPTPDADHLPIAQYALLDLDGIRKSDKALLRTLQSLKLSERDHLGRTALQALAAAEFEAEDRQVHKADLLYMSAAQTAQEFDLDAQDKDGNSALHLAVQTEQVALVEWLVRKGADPELENNAGQTALHMACALHGHHRIYQLLQAAISMLDMQAELSQLGAKRQARVAARVR